MRLATEASASQRLEEYPWKAVHRRRQPAASSPEGPAEPWTRIAAWRIRSPSSWSKRTGWVVVVVVAVVISIMGHVASGWGGLEGGCLLFKMSLTVVPLMLSSRFSTSAHHSDSTV